MERDHRAVWPPGWSRSGGGTKVAGRGVIGPRFVVDGHKGKQLGAYERVSTKVAWAVPVFLLDQPRY